MGASLSRTVLAIVLLVLVTGLDIDSSPATTTGLPQPSSGQTLRGSGGPTTAKIAHPVYGFRVGGEASAHLYDDLANLVRPVTRSATYRSAPEAIPSVIYRGGVINALEGLAFEVGALVDEDPRFRQLTEDFENCLEDLGIETDDVEPLRTDPLAQPEYRAGLAAAADRCSARLDVATTLTTIRDEVSALLLERESARIESWQDNAPRIRALSLQHLRQR